MNLRYFASFLRRPCPLRNSGNSSRKYLLWSSDTGTRLFVREGSTGANPHRRPGEARGGCGNPRRLHRGAPPRPLRPRPAPPAGEPGSPRHRGDPTPRPGEAGRGGEPRGSRPGGELTLPARCGAGLRGAAPSQRLPSRPAAPLIRRRGRWVRRGWVAPGRRVLPASQGGSDRPFAGGRVDH